MPVTSDRQTGILGVEMKKKSLLFFFLIFLSLSTIVHVYIGFESGLVSLYTMMPLFFLEHEIDLILCCPVGLFQFVQRGMVPWWRAVVVDRRISINSEDAAGLT